MGAEHVAGVYSNTHNRFSGGIDRPLSAYTASNKGDIEFRISAVMAPPDAMLDPSVPVLAETSN
jgi:hypothetical protein